MLSVTSTWGNRTIDCNSGEWRKMRSKVLVKYDNKCRFCGHQSEKYMVIDHMDGVASNNKLSNLGVNCQACDAIRHCGFNEKSIVLGISKLTQTEIVNETRKYYKENNKCPTPYDIDPNVKLLNIECKRYSNMLLNGDIDEKFRSKIKGFFRNFKRW